MFLKKQNFPEVDELVFCTVTSVQSHSIFVRLEEYSTGGMIHISEVAPGRIRNIRDFVVENKPIVCKVIGVNPERGHIDLSLRRVTESQRRAKINDIKQEQKAEKIVELVAKQLTLPAVDLFGQISTSISGKFSSIFESFMALSKGEAKISEFGLPENVSKVLDEAVMQRIKPPVVEIKGKFSILSYDPNGISIVRDALNLALKEGVSVSYLGAGTYLLKVTADNYKDAELVMGKATSAASLFVENKGGTSTFEKLSK
jgi:translation initiation factor 2 subunit 1